MEHNGSIGRKAKMKKAKEGVKSWRKEKTSEDLKFRAVSSKAPEFSTRNSFPEARKKATEED